MKQITLTYGDQSYTLTHGMKELVALSKLTKRDLIKGEHWLSELSIENVGAALAILCQRAHPGITEDALLETLPAEAVTDFLKQAPALLGVQQDDPLTPSGSGSEPSAASPSA